jgi:hypothetical protein
MPHPAPAHKSFADRNGLYLQITDRIIAELEQGRLTDSAGNRARRVFCTSERLREVAANMPVGGAGLSPKLRVIPLSVPAGAVLSRGSPDERAPASAGGTGG